MNLNETDEFDRETAVTDSLPYAMHLNHDDWRSRAKALIEGLRLRGYEIVRVVNYEKYTGE